MHNFADFYLGQVSTNLDQGFRYARVATSVNIRHEIVLVNVAKNYKLLKKL